MSKYLSLNNRLMILIILFSCSVEKEEQETQEIFYPVTNDFLVDHNATEQTVALYEFLRDFSGNGTMFGHQDDLAYGIGWWAEDRRSDVKDVCGDYPAVFGWDLGDITRENNLDGVNFDNMINWMRSIHQMGGIITISMHLDNPISNQNAWDNSEAVSKILPGESGNLKYRIILQYIAEFLDKIKTNDGTYIPVILRPYHEHNHTWAWWGANSCSIDEYNALWRMTVEYLRDESNLHHILYAISPQDISSADEYLSRYPGDEWVDIFGMDSYSLWNLAAITNLGEALSIVNELAYERGKVVALTEVGIENVPIANWWTDYLLEAIKYNEFSRKTVWALVWRNHNTEHHFAPYPGHASATNFIEFFNDPFTVFLGNLNQIYP
ncbi:MAG: glycosyl hydrolase [Candidatus Marinimicrobia bacterium]|jgi:mannan endo-1,4-beta-mannosidase|nr:glycosyl hydrolase [Candidatus Neomarinimicrobiota bacterium]|tara:strand:+ start:236 stop:1378 length:1143 start_codon:yes stop_codon:yes gene_type:complete